MSIAPRRVPSTVRLLPSVLEQLCTRLESDTGAEAEGDAAGGLLFGTAEEDFVKVQVVKPFEDGASNGNGSSKRQPFDSAFQQLLATASIDPDLKSLHLVGWYRVRQDGFVSLLDSDIEFHNRRFRRASDLALIFKSEEHSALSVELYSRSLNVGISRQNYRSGSLRLKGQALGGEPIDVALRTTIDDDSYFRVFQVLDSLDRAEKRERWKGIVCSASKIVPPRLRPKWMRPGITRAVHKTAPAPRADPPRPSTTRAHSMVRLGLSASAVNVAPVHTADPEQPMVQQSMIQQVIVRPTPVPIQSRGSEGLSSLPVSTAKTKLRRISSVIVLVLAIGMTLAWFYARLPRQLLAGKAPQSKISASTGLGFQVEHRQGSLFLRWDPRSTVVRSAKRGILQIDDGSRHRKILLDAGQVTNGFVLYTPTSQDVMFRLEIFGDNGSTIGEIVRVLSGSDSSHMIQTPRLSSVKPVPLSKEPPAYRGSQTRSNLSSQRTSRPASLKPANSEAAYRTSKKPTTGGVGGAQSPVASTKLPPIKNFIARAPSPYVPTRPSKQVMPKVGMLQRSALTRSTDIEVAVRVDESGHVTDARVVNNGLKDEWPLASAALAAAREWTFEPAKMHGATVSSDYMIKFHFHTRAGQQ